MPRSIVNVLQESLKVTTSGGVLVLGGTGMLGHQLAMGLAERHDTTVCVRAPGAKAKYSVPNVRVIDGVDLSTSSGIDRVVNSNQWSVIVNAAGMVKQRPEALDPEQCISLNALLPQRIAGICASRDIRLIHFSTDCVFSGSEASERGESGYRMDDFPDARDLYGLSKLLGEPLSPGTLCIRTSLIGRELERKCGLLEWFLGAEAQKVPGYVNALFNGITTPVAALLVDTLITKHPGLDGIWHVAADPISKYDLLKLVDEVFGLTCEVYPDNTFFCDRRLDGSAFHARTGWHAPSWKKMIEELAGQQAL